MKIEIKLKNKKYCEGCPCLKTDDYAHYFCECGLGYDIEREAVTRGEATGSPFGHPDLVAYYRTIRSKKCIQKE